MKIKLACLGLGVLLAATGAAQAGDFSFGAGLKAQDGSEMPMPAYGLGMRDRVHVPAPIPVPASRPVPEGFTYYLRADLGWSFEPSPSFSESGALYNADTLTYSGLDNRTVTADGLLGGTVGFGAYITPRFRGDLTLDFRAQQDVDASATYDGDPGPPPVTGFVTDRLRVNRVIGLVNAYWDLMARGRFTPYVGAGVGLVYNDIERTHVTTEDDGGGPVEVKRGSGNKTNVGLAAALMAGMSFSWDPAWAIDVNYRALYLEGGSVTASLTGTDTPRTSTATLDDVWEHQIRVGLRLNIW
jgi:opacity protein-like surface antigen